MKVRLISSNDMSEREKTPISMDSCFRKIMKFCFVACVWLFSLFIVRAEPEDKSVIRESHYILVGSEYSYPPYCFVDEEGKAAGFSVDIFRAAASAMSLKVVFKVDFWDQLMQNLKAGDIDALPLVGRTPEREANFDFTFPYLSMHGTIVLRKGDTITNTLADLIGKEIAVMKGDNAEEFLQRIKLNAKLITTPTFEDALLELSNGKYDAVVMQKIVALQLIKKLGITNVITKGILVEEFSQSFCFAVKKGNNQLLSLLNEGLSVIIADGTYRRLHAKWFGPLETSNQMQSRIIVGGDANFPPFEFLDGNGQPAGFNVDLIRKIANQLGITVDFRLKDWNITMKELSRNEIDIVPGMFYSYERDQIFSLSPAHIHLSQAIVVREGTPVPGTMADLKGKSILVQDADLMHDVAIKLGFEDQLTLTVSQEKVLLLLSQGGYDCALVSKLSALYWIKKHDLKNLYINPNPVLSAEFCFAVAKGNEALLAQFSEGLASLIATGEYRQIYSKWFDALDNQKPGFVDILKYSLVILIPILILLIGSLIWSRTLQKRVYLKTLELQNEVRIRKTAEEKLRESENHYRELIENIWEGIGIVDTDENFVFANPAAAYLLGVPNGDLTGRNLKEFMSRKELLKIKKQTLLRKDGIKSSYELKINVDGEERILLVTATPQTDKDGQYTGTFGVFRDITHRKKAEKAIKENAQQLKELNATKDKFFSIIAHDLRNPVNSILTFSDLLLTNFKNYNQDKLEKFLISIHNLSKQAFDLLENLLIWAKSQTGKISMDSEILNINSLISYNTSLLKEMALRKNISISYPPDNNFYVFADKNMINTVLRNLITNAIKYTPSGGKIEIHTELLKNQVKISVEDSGMGMTKEIKNNLFLIERSISTPGTENEKGTGLGLILCKEFVERHGGKIWVESDSGKGSKFMFTLPLSAPE